MLYCISQFILEDSGILDPIAWWDINALHCRCHSAHSVHSFSSQSEQYFSATSVVFFWTWITNCFHDGSISRNIMTLIIYKKKINIIILKFRLFKSVIARLLFVQSDVFCALCICRRSSFRNESEGVGVFWSWHEGWKACKDNTQIKFKKKQTNTEASNLTFCFCFHAENPVAN